MNVVVLRGRLSRPAERRVLPSGDELVQLEVSVENPEGRREGVPVVWLGAPISADELDVDDEVVVRGRVRRRFFRTGGSTASRTEVITTDVCLPRHRKKVDALMRRALAGLDEAV